MLKTLVFALLIPVLALGETHNLSERYSKLSCSLVLITSENGSSGTGTFISADGKVLTAAHVIAKKNFSVVNQTIQVSSDYLPGLKATPTKGSPATIDPATMVEDNQTALQSDLVIIKTGIKAPCWLKVGDSDGVQIGQHLIAMGFAGIDFGSASIYDGFLSGRHIHPPVPIGKIGSFPVIANYNVFKVQMPITPGTSGSAVLDDDDKIVAVISEAPIIWTDELSQLIQIAGKVSNFGMSLEFGNGVSIDPTRLLAELAFVVHEFESPGTGFAVPVFYLHYSKQ